MKERIKIVLKQYGISDFIISMIANTICREIEEHFNLKHLELNEDK